MAATLATEDAQGLPARQRAAGRLRQARPDRLGCAANRGAADGGTVRRGDHRRRRDRRRGGAGAGAARLADAEPRRAARRRLRLDQRLGRRGPGLLLDAARHGAGLRGLPLLAALGGASGAAGRCRAGPVPRVRLGRRQDRRQPPPAPGLRPDGASSASLSRTGTRPGCGRSCPTTTCSASRRRVGRTTRPSATATARSRARCCSRPAATSTIRSWRRATCSGRPRPRAPGSASSRKVADIRRERGRVAGVTLADGSPVDAPVVVNVAGPHSSRGQPPGRGGGRDVGAHQALAPGGGLRPSTAGRGLRQAPADLRRRRRRRLLALRHRQPAPDRQPGARLRPAGLGRRRRLEPRAHRAVDRPGLPRRPAHPEPADPAAGAGHRRPLRRLRRLDPDLRPLRPGRLLHGGRHQRQPVQERAARRAC